MNKQRLTEPLTSGVKTRPPMPQREKKNPSRIAQLRSMPYAEYLQTAEWKEKRDFVLGFACHRCQVCNSPKNLHVHHRTYERRGDEDLDDLIALCKTCHELYHRKSNAKEAKEHIHQFKITVENHITIRFCEECGQSSILLKLKGANEYRWQSIKE